MLHDLFYFTFMFHAARNAGSVGLQKWRKAAAAVKATNRFAQAIKNVQQVASNTTELAKGTASTLTVRAVDKAASYGLRAVESAVVKVAESFLAEDADDAEDELEQVTLHIPVHHSAHLPGDGRDTTDHLYNIC